MDTQIKNLSIYINRKGFVSLVLNKFAFFHHIFIMMLVQKR